METTPRNKICDTLHEAVESGNLEVFETLLGNINIQNADGDTLLHVAVIRNGHKSQELVSLLLERGANPGLRNRNGESPLSLGVRLNPNCVLLILRNGSGKKTVNIPDGWGNYPLHYALENETVLKMLLDNGAFIECKDKRGRTALHLASSKTNFLSHGSENQPNYNPLDVYYNVANQLLMHGAKVNSKDNYGNKPLHMAIDIKCVRLLLYKGTLVNSRNNSGKTPLHKAIGVSYDVANELLTHGAEVNSKENEGNTPLHMTYDIKIVKLLLYKGALVNSQNHSGQTPLHKIISFRYDVANELLMHGADVNSKDDYGDTPLHMTFDLKTVRLLLGKGALVNSRNYSGKTPLHKAIGVSYDVANELLMHGADVNIKDHDRNTPLHLARDIKSVELLLWKGAEVNSQDRFGRTILHYLENFSGEGMTYSYFANLLLDCGASLTIKDNEGRTPSDIHPDLLYWAKLRNVRRACVKLSDISCEGLDLDSYRAACLEEADRLKHIRFGKHFLIDIFCQVSDPIFLSNELLQKAVKSIDEIEFPVYFALLKSTYKLAEKRSCMLGDAADTLQTPLPIGITWYILTFVDDDSLRNVIRAKHLKKCVKEKGLRMLMSKFKLPWFKKY